MRSILSLSPFVPAEWVAAHGFRPARIVPPPSGRSARAGSCPWLEDAREAFSGTDCREVAGIVLTTTCDQTRRAAETLDAAAPVFLLNVPHTTKPSSHRLYREELDRLGRWLVDRGGVRPDPARRVEVFGAYDDARRALRSARGLLSGRAWSEAVREFLRIGEPRFERPPGPAPGRGVPIAILGGPLWGPHLELHRLIEEAGGEVVLDGSETGERGLPAPYDRRRFADEPLGEVVEAHFGAIPDAFRRPDRDLYRWLAERLPERGVRGVIVARCVWCDLWHAEVARLREWCDVPVADLDLTGEAGSLARTETRVQALVDSAR